MRFRGSTAIVALMACAGSAFGQDSVSRTPGVVDSLSPYAAQSVRYAVDLIPVVSSWGKSYAFAPVLKSSAGPVEWGLAQANGASAASADQRLGVMNTGGGYAVWGSAGQGVHPANNDAPGMVSVPSFDRVFALALNDVGTLATNVIVGEIGQRSDEPGRLYVTRRVAVSSRASALAHDSATVSIGSVDAHGNLTVRADDFNAHAKSTVHGDLVARVDTAARSGAVNALFYNRPPGAHGATDPGATTIVFESDEEVVNTPTSVPESMGGPTALMHDFSIEHLAEGGVVTGAHLGGGVDAHRGNPAFFDWNYLGGVGAVSSLGRSVAGGKADAINIYSVDVNGAVVGVRSERLPASVGDPTTGFTVNQNDGSVFHHYWSQVSFRGPNGQVALGYDTIRDRPIAAATGRNNVAGEFIAVARLGAAPTQWTIAAHVGKPILDGAGGATVATISARQPVSISSPAADDQGNLYFIAGTTRVGTQGVENSISLIRAVNTAGGYVLEEILRTGQHFVGANSATPFTIVGLSLGDADSVSSASVHAGSIVGSGKGRLPGERVNDPSDAVALGGLAVSAVISYNNGGTPESYHTLLYVGGVAPDACPGDANGDGAVDVDDLNEVLSAWGLGAPSSTGPEFTGDGVVDVDDLNVVLGEWGASCP
ncbi:MAG: hypothetical protein KDA16_02430 [Phycisphaerales bacterium]|nr:hypothetical protein [Phycisphaerales bacterium]